MPGAGDIAAGNFGVNVSIGAEAGGPGNGIADKLAFNRSGVTADTVHPVNDIPLEPAIDVPAYPTETTVSGNGIANKQPFDRSAVTADAAMARRYYGTVQEEIAEYATESKEPGAYIALEVANRINQNKVRDWKDNHDALNRMRRAIDDLLFETAEKYDVEFPMEVQDKLIDRCIEIAIANESE